MNQREEVLDLFRRSVDPTVFAEEVLGVRLNRAQRRWVRILWSADEPRRWKNKFIIHVAANQIGKTLGLAIIILWACHNKIGVDARDERDWLTIPYQWFHVSPTQQQAYLVLKDIELLVKGAHPAQATKPHLPEGLVNFTKIEQYYDGLTLWNGAVVQFRTTEDKAKALQGRRAAGISFDECAFENHLRSVVNETLLMRLVSTGGPLILVSTPNGINDYFEMVNSVIETGTEIEDRLWESPDGSALVWSTISDNVGFGLTQVDVDRMEQDLDPATKEQQLRGAFLEPLEAYFTPISTVLDAFRPELPEASLPVAGRSYVIFWDPSVSSDPTAVVVIDVTDKVWKGVYYKWYARPLHQTQLLAEIHALHAMYNGAHDRFRGSSRAITGFDATSMGGQMLRQALAGVNPQRPLNFAGPTKKMDMLSNLRAAMARGALILPESWTRLKRELLNYRLDDNKLQQDSVMALGGAAQIAAHGFSGTQRQRFDPHARVAQTTRYF